MDIFEFLWYSGFVPLTIILMLVIGWATPENIVKSTYETPKPTKIVYRRVLSLVFIFGVLLIMEGIVLAISDIVIQNNGNFRGYSLISFGFMLFSFTFTTIQAQWNGEFIENLMKKIKMNLRISNQTHNYDRNEKILYFSRILLIIGCEICIIGSIFIFLDNFPINSGQIRSIVMVSIGFATIVFAGSFERLAINEIIQSQILNKI